MSLRWLDPEETDIWISVAVGDPQNGMGLQEAEREALLGVCNTHLKTVQAAQSRLCLVRHS